MKILNIHGYKGSFNNTNYNILKDAGYEVISLQLDYDSCTPDDVVTTLSNVIEEEKLELIVATSFGSFFGKILSYKYNIRLVATNPCLRPEISLKKLSPAYFKEGIESQIRRYVVSNQYIGYSNDTFIIGNNDEVINHNNITLIEANEAKIIVVEGNHRLNRKNYEAVLLKEVEK